MTRSRTLLARESVRAAFILLLILNILFFPCIWGNKSMLDSAQASASILRTGAWAGQRVQMAGSKTIDPAAAAWFFEPSLAFTAYEYTKEKAIPLWNPYQAYGAPFAANMQSQPFYPLTILLSLHLTPLTYNLYLLARIFIAGFFGYLYARLFVSFVPAMAAGIAAMLSGYYILFITMPHLSVEVLTTAALYTGEMLLRTRAYRWLIAFAAVLFLVIIGGMPESSLLIFLLLYPYLIVRIFSDPQLRPVWIPISLRVALASVAGFCLSLILLLPFLEFVRHGYDVHRPEVNPGTMAGLAHYAPDWNFFTYLFPLIYGPYHGLANEFGMIAFFLTIIAISAVLRRNASDGDRRLQWLSVFFAGFAAFWMLKRYGIAVNGIGRLPLLRYVFFYKYEEAVVSVSMAVLCAIGLERLIKAQVSKTILAVALAVSVAMAPLAVLFGQSTIIAEFKTVQLPLRFPEIAIGIGLAALFCLAICLIAFERRAVLLGVSILTLLALELSLNYVPALYYLGNSLPNQSQNPYAGAPYISFLKSKCSRFERVFARDAVLYPDWASAFQLHDIRDLDAMDYWKYLPFVRNFVTPRPPTETQELWNRFTGWEVDYAFNTPLEKRLLQLSSTKYIVSTRPYAEVPFRLIYDHEVKLYEYTDVVPRAAIYYRAEIANSETDALKKLADPSFDVFQTATINAASLTKAQAAGIAQMNQGGARPVTAATIASYMSQAVEIHASLGQAGILVLNDTGYPGWDVTVDGERGKWMSANYLFRGVLLSPGTHVVRFLYRPRTFYTGATIALITLILLLIPAIRAVRAKQSPFPAALHS